MRAKGFMLVISSIIILTTIGCASSDSYLWRFSSITAPFKSLRTIPQGTMLDDLDLSGLSNEKAKSDIKAWAEDKLEQKVLLVYNEREIKITPKELGISLDFDNTWQDVENNYRNKVSSTLALDEMKLKEILQEKLSEYHVEPVDATFTIEEDQFQIAPETPGQAVAIDSLLKVLEDRSLSSIPQQIPVKMKEVPAEITAESLEELAFDGVIGECTTRFNENELNRTSNLKAATATLDKTLLKPGQILSFNEAVGPRTEEAGYKDAYIILNNEFIKGIGGGICQVSSTLYSAAVLANIKVLERTPHAVAVSYIPAGQDATVYYPDLDLKICNDTASYAYIRTEAHEGELTIRIYGKKTNQKIRFRQEIEEEINYETVYKSDSSLSPGTVVQDQKGNKGYVVNTWKVITDQMGKESQELLSHDKYAPANRILRVGAD